jgi:DNA-binding XRE family transcriptional regulator
MVGTRIPSFRTTAGITQKQLADLVKTSEQQIHLIETGKQPVPFGLAVKICSALDEPMESVFPCIKKPAGKLRMAMDMDSSEWTFGYRLRGGSTGTLPISGTEKDRLFEAVQRFEIGPFVVFDSEGSTIVLNINHLIFCHFLSNPPSRMHPKQAHFRKVKVWTADSSEPFLFEVNADEHDRDNLEELGQFEVLLFTAEHASGEANVMFYFKDIDGKEAFFRASEVAMIQIPLWVLEADLFEIAYEQASESSLKDIA